MSENQSQNKHIFATIKEMPTDEGIIVGIASSEDEDRVGDTVAIDGWITDKFMKNPVLLWAHRSSEFPIGLVHEVWKEGKNLMFKAQFHLKDELSRKVFDFMRDGILKTFSVGFIPLQFDSNDFNRITKQELLEISVVPIPANAEAMVSFVKAFDFDHLKALEGEQKVEKAVIPYSIHGETPTAPENTEWDASGELRKADVETLKKMSAWFDSEKADSKAAYKLPHHKADDQDTVVWKGVASAMASLLGAQGGSDIPEGDRKGVYNHLSKHYQQFNREAPEFRHVEDQILKNGTSDQVKDFLLENPEIAEVLKDIHIKALRDLGESIPDTQGGAGTHTTPSKGSNSPEVTKKMKVLRVGVRDMARIASELAKQVKEI